MLERIILQTRKIMTITPVCIGCNKTPDEIQEYIDYAREENILQAFKDGLDIYTEMGKWLYDLPKLSQEQRQWNKNAINASDYAAQDKTMATTLHTTEEKAKRYNERWRGPTGLNPGIGRWHRKVDT